MKAMEALQDSEIKKLVEDGELVPPARIKEVDRVRLDAKMPEYLYNRLAPSSIVAADRGDEYFVSALSDAVKEVVLPAVLPLLFSSEEEQEAARRKEGKGKGDEPDAADMVDNLLLDRVRAALKDFRSANGGEGGSAVGIVHALHSVATCDIVKSELILTATRSDVLFPAEPEGARHHDLDGFQESLYKDMSFGPALDHSKSAGSWGVPPISNGFQVQHPKKFLPGALSFFDRGVRIYLLADAKKVADEPDFFVAGETPQGDRDGKEEEMDYGEQLKHGGEVFTARVWARVTCDETFGYSWGGGEGGGKEERAVERIPDALHLVCLEAEFTRNKSEGDRENPVMKEDFEWKVVDFDNVLGGNHFA